MKKSLLALAALTAFAGAASAQSSVTLFGIVDAGMLSVKNGSAARTATLSQDGINSSRIGFRGLEDLGGGLRAGFWIEGAFGPDTGCGGSGTIGSPVAIGTVSTTVNQGTGAALPAGSAPSVTAASQTCTGQTWQRRATVSLIGNFGEVRLGRDYTTTFNNIAAYDPFGYNGTGHVGNVRSALGSGATTAVRANNTVAYFLPALGGIYGQLQVAAGEGVTNTTNAATGNKEVGGRLGYAAGPVNVSGAYQKTYKTGTMLDDLTTWSVGGSFNAGFLTVSAAYEREDYLTFDQKLALGAVQVPLGSGTLKASYIRTGGNARTAAGGGITLKSSQYALGYVYDLSKRTALYAQGARINNGGSTANGATFTVYGANGGSTTGFTPGQNSTGYQVGIRHIF